MERPALLRLAVVLLILGAGVAIATWPSPPAVTPPPGGTGARPSPAAADRGTEPPPVPAKGMDATLLSGSVEEARRAAADLRRRIRTDPEEARRAAARLLDPATPPALREALALVLGTLDRPETDAL